MKQKLSWIVIVFLLMSVSLAAQTFRGTILGTVTDPTGALVPDARVTVRNLNTGLVRETQTTNDGSYSVPELSIGPYSVTVEKEGFQTSVVDRVTVEVAAERRVDVSLQVGEITQRIEVSAATLPLVETTSNVLGGTLEARQVEELPINGRDFSKLLIMVPGAAGEPNAGGDSPGSFGLFSVNGNRGRSNNFLLDGTDMNDGYRNLPSINQGGVFGTPGTVLPVESIAEVRILSNFEPEYGRNSGSVVNIVTKSGTNDFHGSLFEFFRHDSLNARNFFNQGVPQDKFNNNQFGASVGGPLVKNRTFWFFTYEGQREKVGVTSVNRVPTLEEYAVAIGELQGLLPAGTPAPGCTTSIIDCLRNNQADVNEVILNLYNFCDSNGGCSGGPDVWPVANVPGAAPGDLNSISSAQAFNDADSLIIKIDHSFSDANQISGRYFFGNSEQSFPLGLGAGNNLPGTNTFSPIRAQLVSISDVHVFAGGTRVNEARFGWNFYQQDFLAANRDVFGNPNDSFGLNNGVTDERDFGLPTIFVDGFATLGSSAYANPRGRDDTNWHFIDNVSWKAGRHDIKFGYEFRRTTVDSFYDALYRGQLGFDTLTDFLGGNIGGGRLATGVSDRETAQNSHALYVQDSFRWRSDFTLNLGLRWEYFGVLSESGDRFSRYDPAVGLFHPDKLYPEDWNNFSPRLSFAWDIGGKGKTVVRGGFGVFYDIFSQDFFTGQIPWNCYLCTGVAYNAIDPDPVFLSLTPVALIDGVFVFDPTTTGPGTPDTLEVFTVDDIRTPYVYNFNLNLQQQLGQNTVVQIGYVGSAGRKLYRTRDINQPDQAAIDANDPVGGCCVPRPFDSAAVLSPVAPNPPFFVNQVEASSNSNYNALQVVFRQQNWHGFTQQASWTWSHSIDDASDGQEFVPNASQPQDSTNARGNRGSSNFDTRHHFVWSLTYNFPKWEAAGRFGEGWQISSVLTLMSGHPFNLNYFFDDDYDGSGSFYGRPDLIGAVRYNHSDPFQFLDLSAFTVPCTLQDRDVDGDTIVDTSDGSALFCTPGSRHFGTLGRNALLGPDYRNLDLSIVKTTRITERVSIQFRADFFNITNHPNFANPYMPIFFAPAAPNGIDPATGVSLGSYPILATSDVGLGNPILAGGGPRSIQFALKFIF